MFCPFSFSMQYGIVRIYVYLRTCCTFLIEKCSIRSVSFSLSSFSTSRIFCGWNFNLRGSELRKYSKYGIFFCTSQVHFGGEKYKLSPWWLYFSFLSPNSLRNCCKFYFANRNSCSSLRSREAHIFILSRSRGNCNEDFVNKTISWFLNLSRKFRILYLRIVLRERFIRREWRASFFVKRINELLLWTFRILFRKHISQLGRCGLRPSWAMKLKDKKWKISLMRKFVDWMSLYDTKFNRIFRENFLNLKNFRMFITLCLEIVSRVRWLTETSSCCKVGLG